MSAEEIAKVVADLRNGNIRRALSDPHLQAETDAMLELLVEIDPAVPVVDATAIYKSLVVRETGIAFYEDHNVAPPWDASYICYVNEHGNVVAMVTLAVLYDGDRRSWETNEDCDWDRVKWITGTWVYVGGRSQGMPVPTVGPIHAWQIASYEDGTIGDIHWHHIYEEKPLEDWDMAALVLLGTLTFFGARNVELAEPIRPRAIRRRIERAAPGVTVKELVVFPAGKSTRSRGGEVLSGGIPLTSVRGHYAKYGIDGRGLLFGKIAGRFWIPAHARGSEEHGQIVHNYRIETQPKRSKNAR